MEIVQGVASEENTEGVNPQERDLVGRQSTFIEEECSLGLSVAWAAPGVCVVRVVGELELLTGPLLERCLREQLAVEPAHLVVDLQAVGFMGSAGLATLMMARDLAQVTGSMLYLTGLTQQAVVRPLEVSGLLPLFNLYPTLTDVLSDLPCEHGKLVSTRWPLTDADTG